VCDFEDTKHTVVTFSCGEADVVPGRSTFFEFQASTHRPSSHKAMIPASYWIFVAIVASLYPYQASAGPFHITLDYSNVPWTDQFFTHCAARNRWERVITGDLEDINNPNLPNLTPPTDCGRFPASIDDCYVCISYRNNMDGEGGILAVGFQNVLRSNALALIGSIEVDQTDIPSMKRRGIFRNVMVSPSLSHFSTHKIFCADK